MRLYYQTEFRIGESGRRISRRYTGARALAAIIVDLGLKLWLELIVALVGLAAWLSICAIKLALLVVARTWRAAAAVMTVIVYMLTLPFALVHRAVDRLLARRRQHECELAVDRYLKPEWALGREV